MEIARRVVPDTAEALARAGLPPVLARIYAARGIAEASELEHSLARLPGFTSFRGMAAAAKRLGQAIERDERLLIVGDYDADGATASAVAVLGLRSMGARVDFLVPNRFEYGYGLTPEIVALAATREPDILITVDNGIASVDGVAAAHGLGIEVIITDHHLPGERLPEPALIVNPNQRGCEFPSKNLAGVGVMFYLLLALRALLREQGSFRDRPEPRLVELLDLVALGTVADVVRLDHVNRILVDQGLRRIRAGKMRPGIRALFHVARRDPRRASAYDLGFVAGPRLNAAGRLADMTLGIQCLLEDDELRAAELARALDDLNRERRSVEATMQDEALLALDDLAQPDAFTVCLFRPEWHQGVVGIVASRLKDRFHRPAIIFARGKDGELRGSGRGIAGFHLRDALDLVSKRTPGSILRFGGHAFAAGLSLRESTLEAFMHSFEAVAREQLSPAMLRQRMETDGPLPPELATLAFAREIGEQVWGQGFPAPSFDDDFEVIEERVVGEKHVRLSLRRDHKRFDAIAFNHPPGFPAHVRLAYRLEVEEYQGLAALQLVVEHWRPA